MKKPKKKRVKARPPFTRIEPAPPPLEEPQGEPPSSVEPEKQDA